MTKNSYFIVGYYIFNETKCLYMQLSYILWDIKARNLKFEVILPENGAQQQFFFVVAVHHNNLKF